MSTETRSQRRWSQALRAAGCLSGSILFLAPGVAHSQIAAIGLSSVRAQAFFNQELEINPPDTDEYFGYALAAGDFNGDGAQDLATGMPGDDGPIDLPLNAAGAVIVRWGSPGTGLMPATPTLLSLYSSGLTQAYPGDYYGKTLAAGDFNGDGRDDLAVGVPSRNTGPGCQWTYCTYGAVQIHYGIPGGIQVAGGELLQAGPNSNVPDLGRDGEQLGSALAAGDFNGDGYCDLAMSERLEWNTGAVVVVNGSSEGLIDPDGVVVGGVIHQDDPPVPDDGEDFDYFGYALAVGNFNGDLRFTDRGAFPIDDLAMSAPGEDHEGQWGKGAVMIMLGSEFGLIFANSIYLRQDDVGGVGEVDDQFGRSLAAGNFDGDFVCVLKLWCTDIDDLAIGAPFEDLGASNEFADAGEVTVLYGQLNGYVDLARTDHLRQSGIFGSNAYDQPGDKFGYALAAGDFDRDGRDDLAIGQPGEDLGGADRGGVTILMGAVGGLYDRFRFLAAGINGVQPGNQDGAQMGFALAVGDFDATGHSDLAIGIPYRDQAGIGNAGAVSILYGALFADGFASGNDDYWSVTTP